MDATSREPGTGSLAEAGPGVAAHGPRSTPGHSVSVIERSALWWHLGFSLYVVVAVVFFILVVPWPERLGALIPLGVIACAYFLLVVPGWPTAKRGEVYVVIMLVCSIAAIAMTPYSGFFYFFVFGHVWVFSAGLRETIAGFAILPVCLAAAVVIRDGGLSLSAMLLQVALPCLGGFVTGYWIHLIIIQSEDRAELLEALESAQAELARANHAAGAAAERERVARDIHDTLAQGFTSVVLLADAGLEQVGRQDSAANTLRSIRTIAHDNLGEARALVRAGQPTWDDSTFIGALQRTCTAYDGAEVTAEIDEGPTDLDANAKIVVLRGLQEALANIRKHARASRVTVSLTTTAEAVTLEISDDGIGFAPASVPSPPAHFGLFSMRQRVAEVGAELDIDSAPGRGTRLRMIVPRSAAVSAEAGRSGDA